VIASEDLAVVLPVPTELTTATNMRNGNNDTAIQQRQVLGRERCIVADAVCAVAPQNQRRCGAISTVSGQYNKRWVWHRLATITIPEASLAVVRLYTNEIGTCTPSSAVA
jgi:hypothetical protein